MNKRHIFLSMIILILSLVVIDRWQMHSEKQALKENVYRQEDMHNHTEQLLDSMSITLDNVKQTEKIIDTVFIPIKTKSPKPKKDNEDNKIVEEFGIDAEKMLMIGPQEPDNRRIVEYEKTIEQLRYEIQNLNQIIDSLTSENN